MCFLLTQAQHRHPMMKVVALRPTFCKNADIPFCKNADMFHFARMLTYFVLISVLMSALCTLYQLLARRHGHCQFCVVKASNTKLLLELRYWRAAVIPAETIT